MCLTKVVQMVRYNQTKFQNISLLPYKYDFSKDFIKSEKNLRQEWTEFKKLNKLNEFLTEINKLCLEYYKIKLTSADHFNSSNDILISNDDQPFSSHIHSSNEI